MVHGWGCRLVVGLPLSECSERQVSIAALAQPSLARLVPGHAFGSFMQDRPDCTNSLQPLARALPCNRSPALSPAGVGCTTTDVVPG